MSRYVVDASVAIKWFIPEVHSEAALRLCRSQIRLHVPAFVTLELGNVIVKKIRRGELSPAEGETIRGELKQLPLQQHADARLFPAAYQFAIATQRSLYDCLYLALAAAIDGVLVTADRKFYAAVAKGVYGRRVLWVEDLPPAA
ncbi:MAG TPA: type II toxin-antitoxin system VapC family toxin [Nitrospira sp.]|nr:type II toxin-antitoxin system VapC family toxin [Nitrospira sp.]